MNIGVLFEMNTHKDMLSNVEFRLCIFMENSLVPRRVSSVTMLKRKNPVDMMRWDVGQRVLMQILHV